MPSLGREKRIRTSRGPRLESNVAHINTSGGPARKRSSPDTKLSTMSRKTLCVLRREGVLRALMRILQKLCSPFLKFGVIIFFAQDLDFNLPERQTALSVRLNPIYSYKLQKLKECDSSLSEAALQERLKAGDVCFVAIDAHEKIAHSHWVSTSRAYIPELDMDVILGPGEAYMYNATTRPDVRGRGLFVTVRNFFVKRLHADGYKTLFFYVRGDNYIGLRTERRWMRSPGKFWYLQVRGLRPLVIGRRSPGMPQLIHRAKPLGENASFGAFAKDLPLDTHGHPKTAPVTLWEESQPPQYAARKEKEEVSF